MQYANENRIALRIDTSTKAKTALIAAPGAGKRIAIDYLVLHPSGGANDITLYGSIATTWRLSDQESSPIFANSIHSPMGIFPCDDDQAFSIALSAATVVEGYAIYRIVGQ